MGLHHHLGPMALLHGGGGGGGGGEVRECVGERVCEWGGVCRENAGRWCVGRECV